MALLKALFVMEKDMMTRKHSRRALLVNKDYQGSQVGIVVMANLLVALLMAVLVSWFYLMVLDTRLVASHNQVFPILLGVLALLVVLFSTLWSLRSSRRVAGQVRKLAVTMEDAQNGRFPEPPLTFRKDDYFPEMAGPFNACLRKMQRQQEELIQIWQAIREAKDMIAGGAQDQQTLVKALRRLDEALPPDKR